jgi:hypothetical protein
MNAATQRAQRIVADFEFVEGARARVVRRIVGAFDEHKLILLSAGYRAVDSLPEGSERQAGERVMAAISRVAFEDQQATATCGVAETV